MRRVGFVFIGIFLFYSVESADGFVHGFYKRERFGVIFENVFELHYLVLVYNAYEHVFFVSAVNSLGETDNLSPQTFISATVSEIIRTSSVTSAERLFTQSSEGLKESDAARIYLKAGALSETASNVPFNSEG